MKAIKWESNVVAVSKRSLDLRALSVSDGRLHLEVEEESGRLWGFDFGPLQAWKVTSEECAAMTIAALPVGGAMFLIDESDWKNEFCEVEVARNSVHFVICCYDEVVEVMAWGCSINPIS